MAQEMTLNLKLTGVQDLLKAIRELDKALTQLNRKFVGIANSVSATAQKINSVANNVKIMGTFARSGFKRNSGSSTPSGPRQPQAGPFNPRGNPLRWPIQAFDKFASNIGKEFSSSIKGGSGANIGTFTQAVKTAWTVLGHLGRAGVIAFVALTALALIVTVVIVAFKEMAEAAKASAKLLWAAGNNSANANRLRGIGAAAGIDQEKMAGMLGRDSSQGRVLLAQLEAIRGMNPRSAQNFANAAGIDQDLAMSVNQMSQGDWQNAKNGGPDAAINGMSQRTFVDLASASGQLKNAFSELYQTFSPILIILVGLLKIFAVVIQWVAKAVQEWMHQMFSIVDKLTGTDLWAVFKKALSDSTQELDKWTNKIGTFGGRERAQNAIPTAWTYYAYQGNLTRLANALGSFEF